MKIAVSKAKKKKSSSSSKKNYAITTPVVMTREQKESLTNIGQKTPETKMRLKAAKAAWKKYQRSLPKEKRSKLFNG